MSSDSDVEDPRKIRASQGALKSLFASDRKAVENGPQSLKYDPRTGAAAAQAQPAPLPGQTQTVACQAMVVVYRGDQSIGPCFTAVTVPAGGTAAFIIIVNREKKPQCRIRIDPTLQLLINETDGSYATLYDPAIQTHWMMQFKTPAEAEGFVVGALTVQHYIQLADSQGPSESHVDFKAPETGKSVMKAKTGDICHVGYKVWIIQRVGQTQLYTTGKVVEEVPKEAPKAVTIGSNTVMLGIEEGLQGVTKGTKRLIFVPPRKTKSTGLGNPEIAVTDSVVVCITVNSVDRSIATDEFGLPQTDDDESEDDIIKRKKLRKKGKRVDSSDDLPAPREVKMIGAPVTPVVSSPAGGLDTNALLQTMLLQSLQQQKPAQTETANSVASDVQRSVERLHYQIQSLYDKIDRIDFEKYLQTNNQVIERMVKKAVGKMPVNDVDVEDVTKDRNELLALIEKLKEKNQELTDNYHKALENLGKHKDETSGLKNDLSIEREAAGQRYTELKERKRLELVDLEVKHRRVLDKTSETKFAEGKKVGYDEGYSAGKIDAIQISGSSSMDELKQMLHKKDVENVDLQSRLAQMEGRLIQERREYKDQVDALNNLIARMEDRRASSSQDISNDVTVHTKRVRRIMNSLYASVEEQFYATERESIPVADALAMLLVSVKTETRSAVDEIKNEAAVRDISDKANRNEVVEAYTIAAAEYSQGSQRRTKHGDAPDMIGDSPTSPTDVDSLRKELMEYEARAAQQRDEAIFPPSEMPPAPPMEGTPVLDGDDFDFSALPTSDSHDEPPVKVDQAYHMDEVEGAGEGVPDIPFE